MAKRKTITSSEVKARWIEKAYKRYLVNLRYDQDQQLINFIENHKEEIGTTELFRRAITKLVEDEGSK